MAAHPFKIPGIFIVYSVYLAVLLTSTFGKEDGTTPNLQAAGIVHFNNPKLLGDPGIAEDDGYVIDSTQDTADPDQVGGIVILDEAKNMASKLRKLTSKELGVNTMQNIYDMLKYEEVEIDYHQEISKLSEALQKKFANYMKILKISQKMVENLYGEHLTEPITKRYECCNVPSDELRYDSNYQCKISDKTSCDLIPSFVASNAFNPGRNLTDVFQHNVLLIRALKWQYFISVDGIQNEFPTHNFRNLAYSDCRSMQDIRHRSIYVSTVKPERKNVIIIVDHGNSLSDNQLNTAKAVAKHVLWSLSQNDQVSVIALSSTTSFAKAGDCLSKKLVPLTHEAKMYFSAFINGLKKDNTSTSHAEGFDKAFDILYNSLGPKEGEDVNFDAFNNTMIMYISRGLLSSLTRGKAVLKSIADQNGKMGNRVTINTYAVVDDGKPIMYELSFLKDVAAQNFGKYLVSATHNNPTPDGKMVLVNTTRDLISTIGLFYDTNHNITSKKPRVSLPFVDEVGNGMVVAVSIPAYYQGRLLGVLGMDFQLGDLVESVTYFSERQDVYAFLIDINGYTIMHPSMSRPILMRNEAMYTDISHFEYYPEFKPIREAMLEYSEGSQVIEVPREPNNSTLLNELFQLPHFMRIRYVWKKVVLPEMAASPFIVVIKTSHTADHPKHKIIKGSEIQKLPNQVYHRLDLKPTDTTCMHFKQLATMETSALFLAANSFTSPYEHLSQEENGRMVVGYLAYLNDDTALITNPGGNLKPAVRLDYAALSRIDREWLRQFDNGDMKDFVVRRYVTTPNGVMKMFPGTLLNKAYDPSRRPWYTRALEYPGRVIVTAPYLDKGGAGYVVTISHTVYEGKHAALHGPFDDIVAVMGIDITLGYFYKLLVEQNPVCEQKHIRCFMMDDRGYMIAHEGLIEPKGKGPLEQQHITHKEPQVASDILNHEGFVKKKLCKSYSDRTVQRYYHFNTSITGVLTNLIHGEHCARYQVTQIPGTNAFIGVVNQVCDFMAAFCPCSMVDRLCLNCHRMEQSECECPCECPFDTNLCPFNATAASETHKTSKKTNKSKSSDKLIPTCDGFPEDVGIAPLTDDVKQSLPACFKSNCRHRRTKMDCLGVIDCEWCELDVDAHTSLSKPFCDTQRVCFAGVLGAPSPYNDEIRATTGEDESLTYKSTPVGPVAGGIMGCFLVLALGVYCYRHHVHRSTHHYASTMQDNAQHHQLNNEFEESDPPDDPNSGHTNIVLATFDSPAIPSPYRVNTTYRRPAAGDSDHGYSTMTPTHGDDTNSEQASTTCQEPLIISRDRYRPPPNIVKPTSMLPPPPSHNRRSRSPTPPHQTKLSTYAPIPEQSATTILPPGQTVLPEGSPPHNVIASVQVHCVDTH